MSARSTMAIHTTVKKNVAGNLIHGGGIEVTIRDSDVAGAVDGGKLMGTMILRVGRDFVVHLDGGHLTFLNAFMTKYPNFVDWEKALGISWQKMWDSLHTSLQVDITILQEYSLQASDLLSQILVAVDTLVRGLDEAVQITTARPPNMILIAVLALDAFLKNSFLAKAYADGEEKDIPPRALSDLETLSNANAAKTTAGGASTVSTSFTHGEMADNFRNPDISVAKGARAERDMISGFPAHKEFASGEETLIAVAVKTESLEGLSAEARLVELKKVETQFDQNVEKNVDGATKETLLAEKPAWDEMFNKANCFKSAAQIAELAVLVGGMARISTARAPGVTFAQWLKWYRTALGVRCADFKGTIGHWHEQYKYLCGKGSYSPATTRLEAATQDRDEATELKKRLALHTKMIEELQREREEKRAAAVPVGASAVDGGGKKKQ